MASRKYTLGDKIRNLEVLAKEFENENGVYYLNGGNLRYFAPGWYGNLKLSGLQTMIQEGKLFIAMPLNSSRDTDP